MIEVYALANVPDYDEFTRLDYKNQGLKLPKPTIIIYKSSLAWDMAFHLYLEGFKPTNSVDWDKGIYPWFRNKK